MNEYGYVRVSTKEQNEARQLIALDALGVKGENIFIDKQSGKDFLRPQYISLMHKVKSGDTVFIKSIDRLGRDYEEVIKEWQYITKVKDVDIVIIDFPLLDTRNQINGLTGKFLADMVLQVLSYVAQIERENIKQRQMEGIEAAKRKGVQFGRKMTPVHENFEIVLVQWKSGEISLNKASKNLGVDRKTLKKWIEASCL